MPKLKLLSLLSIPIFISAFLLLSLSQTSADIATGLVGYYSFDTGTGADSSGNSNNLALSGTSQVLGKKNTALSFSGASYGVISSAPSSLKPATNVSVSAWIKTSSTDTSGSEIVSMGDSYALRLRTDGNLQFFYYNGSTWLNAVTTGLNLKDNLWHHVVGQKNNSNLEIYVDALLKSSSSKPGSIAYTLGQGFNIGRHGDNETIEDFIGSMDEVRIYNRALSASDVAELYNYSGSFQSSSQSSSLNPLDTTPPYISITSPTSASTYTTTSSSITLSGTASDNVGVASVTCISSTGASCSVSGTTSWSIANIALNIGTNTITVTARDAVGLQTSATISITRQSTTTTGGSNVWQQVTLRSALQKSLGLSGGEGWQAVQDIKYSPSDPNTVYLIVDTSGVWKSTDGGNSWKVKPKGFGSIGGQSIGIHPNNPNIVFAAGSDMSVGSQIPGSLQGIFRTEDGGENWTLVKQVAIYRDRRSKGANMFAFSGTDTVYAATHNGGLLKSTNGGDTWMTIIPQTTLVGGVAMGGVYDIEINPANPAILYMTTDAGLVKVTDSGSVSSTKIGNGLPRAPYQVEINKNNPSVMYVSVGLGGVYKSTDGGVNFSPANSGLNTIDRAYDLTVSPADPNYLYVTFKDSDLNDSNYGFFYSHNGGSSWQAPVTMDKDGIVGSLMGAWYTNRKGHSYSSPVAAHPTNRDIALTDNQAEEPIMTIDGGANWKYSSSGYTGSASGIMSAAPIAWDKTNSSRYVMGFHDYGAVMTNDGGDTFRSMSAGSNTFVGVLEGNLMVSVNGSWDIQGVIVSRDGGSSFTKIAGTDDKYKTMFLHPQNNNIVYAQKFKFTNIQSSNAFTTLSKNVLAVYPKNGNIVYSAGRDANGNHIIYKSIDGGVNWTSPYPALVGSSAGWFSQMAVDPNNENRIYVMIPSGGGVYVITDTVANGGTASLKGEANGIYKDQFGIIRPIAVAVDPRSPNVVYVGMFSPFGNSGGVFRSTDYGNNWTNITRDYFGLYLNIDSLTVNPWNSYVYIGSMKGNWKLPPPGTVANTDTTPPFVSITSPTSASTYTTTSSSITLSGTASDNVGVASVTCMNNGVSCGTVSGTTSWSVNVPLSSGINNITVTARDSAYNTGTKSIAVTRTTTSSSSSVSQSSSSSAGGAYLSDLSWSAAPLNGWGPVEKDKSNGESLAGDGKTITLNGTTYAKGLGTHAYSEITYNLNGLYSSFLSDIGVDDEVGSLGSVVFQVWADNVKLYDSGTMTGSSAAKSVNLSVAGKNSLKLIATNAGDGNGNDHADWANARLVPVTSQSSSSSVSQSSSSSTSNKFSIGNRVVTTDNLNVRSSASLTGTLLGTQPIGSLGYILSNPTVSGGYNWYSVNFDNAPDGYAVDAYMEKTVQSSSSSIPQSSSSSSSVQSSSSSIPQSSSSSSSTPLPALTATSNKTLSPITIDGNLNESVWTITEPVSRTIAGVNNNTTAFNTLWDNQYLYVGVKVLDSVLKNDSTYPWLDDSVEIYLDGAHNHAAAYDANDRQIIKGQGDATAVSFKVATPNLFHGWSPITGGYAMEFAIPWSDLNITPSANMAIGFDLQQNDDDTGGDTQATKGWNSVTGTNYLTTSSFGHLVLSATTVGTLPSSSSSSVPRSSSSSSVSVSSASQSSISAPQSSSSVSTVNKFGVNDRVVTIDNVNVRSSASLAGALLGTQPIGSLGYILSNPTLSDGYSWYNINFDNAPDGYAVDVYMEKTAQSSSSSISTDSSSSSAQSSSEPVTDTGTTPGGGGGTTGTITTFGSYTPSVTQTTDQTSSAATPPQIFSRTTTPKKVAGPFSIGMRSNEVKVLQEMLASDPSVYPEGQVTGFYGPATTKAVKRFQKKHGIEETGLAGTQTRAKLNEVYNQTSQTQSFDQYQTQTVTTSSSVFTRELRLNSEGDDVKELQKRLTSEGVYSGPITGYYGPMTREGVRKYQAKNNLPQVGAVGPMTLELLNGSSSNTATSSSSQGISLTDLVEALINLGVISPDKASAAREAVKGMGR